MKTKLCRPIIILSNPNDETAKGVFNTKDRNWYNIYLISLDPDEKIEPGDMYIHFNANTKEYTLFRADSRFNEGNNPNIIDKRVFVYTYWNKKVIATQSQLLPEYIQQFIEEYNNGNR